MCTSSPPRRNSCSAERPDAPGCLVLDVRLPGMSGLTFQQELVESRCRSPGHLHHRARRRSDDRACDEGRRGRVPHQTVRRSGAARCDPCGHRARSRKAPRRGEPYRGEGPLPRAHGARARGHEARRGGTSEQADRGRAWTEPGHREGPPRPGHAQDAGEIGCRSWCVWPTGSACRVLPSGYTKV